MLSLVNKYGLSHVCANPEFQNIEHVRDGKVGDRTIMFNFPYIDMHFNLIKLDYNLDAFNIEFFLRGTKDKELEFQNLFEYLFWTSLHGPGLKYILLKTLP